MKIKELILFFLFLFNTTLMAQEVVFDPTVDHSNAVAYEQQSIEKEELDNKVKVKIEISNSKFPDNVGDLNNNVYYTIYDKTNVTWLPLSGAYDPEVNSDDLKFKDVQVTQGSSLSVNSFLWTNSSVTDKAGNKIPAAMFLHGAEDHGDDGSYNGRHIHALLGTDSKDNIKAEPQQAGAVRCIRDVPKNFNESNKVPSKIELAASAGSAVTITKNSKEFVSINDTWKVVDPGAPWVKVTPTQGTYDAGAGQELKFTALETNNTGNERSTVVKIKFDSEVNARSITVIQEAN